MSIDKAKAEATEAMAKIAAEAIALGQLPSEEHEISDWINCIVDEMDAAVDVVNDDEEMTDPDSLPAVRKCLLLSVAVALAAIVSIDAAPVPS